MNTERFASLWNPESIAIVGASERASSWTREIYCNLTGLGFSGTIVPPLLASRGSGSPS